MVKERFMVIINGVVKSIVNVYVMLLIKDVRELV